MPLVLYIYIIYIKCSLNLTTILCDLFKIKSFLFQVNIKTDLEMIRHTLFTEPTFADLPAKVDLSVTLN